MDLMSNNEYYEFKELARKYGNFLNPAMQIFVDGKEVARSGKILVQNLHVTLSCEEASAARFSVAAAYKTEESSFNTSIMKLLGLGKEVSIKMGYGSAMVEVFRGYISEVELEYNEQPAFNVTLMDLRKLMMACKRVREMTVRAPSEAVNKVMDSYRKFYDHLSVEGDKAENEPFQIKQNSESDYHFIKRLCHHTGKEFFVLGSCVYYQTRDRYPNPVIKLATQGGGILSFSSRVGYEVKKFLVIGREPNSSKEIYRSRTYRSEFVSKTLIATPQPTVYASPSIKAVADAEKWLDDAVKQEKAKGISAVVRCVGLPDLGPGHNMECSGLGSPFDRKYYIEKVEHSMDAGGFSTQLTLGG